MKYGLTAMLLAATVAFAAEADALRIGSVIRQRHLPFNAIIDPVFASPESDEIVGYSRCGDSAIWTGHYLAAESYRYAVTKSPEALEQVKIALGGISVLFLITGNQVAARCAFAESFPFAEGMLAEERNNGTFSADFGGERWHWIGNTSRDQYAGIYFGLTAAWDVVDDPDVKATLRWLVELSLDRLIADNWTVRMPDGRASTSFSTRPDLQLMIMKLGARTNPEKYQADYARMSTDMSDSVLLPVLFDTLDPYSSYFKFNLAHITFYGLLTSDDAPGVRANYRRAWDLLRRTTDDHDNAYFDLIARAVEGARESRDLGAAQMLMDWLRRPARDAWVDLRGAVAACGRDDRACNPIPVASRVTTDFVWQRSPFQMVGGGFGKIETAGVDYILPYWMARYYGVVAD